jgi:CDP-glucose 4,6-dehydratase
MFLGVYQGRRVLVTGHTGFKGSWLSAWLLHLGAEVAGVSVGIPTTPSGFEAMALGSKVQDYRGDIRDRDSLRRVLESFKPEMVFHLAAQALVRRSHEEPALTFETNAIGTMNVLECLRINDSIRTAVIVTSDKCYQNVEWVWGYRETDSLGGSDPYSGSKGCAELVAHSYIASYFAAKQNRAAVATARAGNVVGGGDWAADRLVPDCVRSWSEQRPVGIRNPAATRPWQHVLEPLSGYLWLGSHLWQRTPAVVGQAYNFGPDSSVSYSVEGVLDLIHEFWPSARWTADAAGASAALHEARLLKLCCDKAQAELHWTPVLSLRETVRFTVEWYRRFYDGGPHSMFDYSLRQIAEYYEAAGRKGLEWHSQ